MNYTEQTTRNGGYQIVIHQTEMPHPQANLASELMRHLAIVAAMPDGVDEAGRQKLRLMTEEEVVARAGKIADLAWKDYRARGWLLDIPMPKPTEEKP